LLRQLLPWQAYGAHDDSVGGRQVPAPSQCEVGVSVEPVHDWVPQETVEAASAQAPEPSHAPVLPQGGFAVQRESFVPAPTFVHIPEVPHAWQRGQLATPQQWPSVQSPVPHSWAAAQVAPDAFFGMQAPPAPVQ
jgi:hypothetical protein